MTNKQLKEVVQTPTTSSQGMSQAEAENLVDLLYTQRLVTNGSTILASHAQHTGRTRQSLQGRSSQQPETLATLLGASIETSLRLFLLPLSLVPLFFKREIAEETEIEDSRGQEPELTSQREYALVR